MVDLQTFSLQATFVVFDDFEFKFLPNKKSWWGAQDEFTMTDKYTRKRTIKWGKPAIYLCNPEDDPSRLPEWNTWFDENCITIVIYNKLY